MFQCQSLSYRGNVNLMPTGLKDPLEKEARFHGLRAFPYFLLQFELVLALWCYTVVNVALNNLMIHCCFEVLREGEWPNLGYLIIVSKFSAPAIAFLAF